MIIYNVTVKVDWTIANAWKEWMVKEHIPMILQTGCFEKYQFVKLLEVDETEGPTFAAQYFAPSKAKYDEYIRDHAAAMRQEGMDKWGDKFIAFRTVMAVVD